MLKELWEEKPEALLGCVIIDFLSDHTDAVHIPFSQFFELAKRNDIRDTDVVLNIVNYLSGANLKLLDTGFELIDGDTVEQLEPSQVKAAKCDNINPLTGETDDEIGEKIFMFFLPSNLAKQALVRK